MTPPKGFAPSVSRTSAAKPSMPFLKSTGRSAISTFAPTPGDNHDAAFSACATRVSVAPLAA